MDGVDTDYVLDPVGLAQVLMEGTGGESIHYLPGLGQYSDAAWRYYLPDRLGSIRPLVDPAGAVLRSQSYDPFGNLLQQGGSGQSTFGYTGEQADPTGLVYLRARYYDPAVGRFLTADSLIPDPLSSGGWNRYVYVENNPLKFRDPSGHCGVSGLALLGPNGPVNFVEECINAWDRVITAYQAGERRPLALASHVYGVTDWLVEQSEVIDQLNADADVVFSNACFEDRILPSIRLGLWSTETAAAIVGIGQITNAAIAGRSSRQTFTDRMDPAEAARYTEYWQRNAPRQVTPGTGRLDHVRVSGRTGRTDYSRVIYDSYGRQIYRVDYTDHLRPAAHSNPHLHEYRYGPGFDPERGGETLYNLDWR